MCKQPIQREVCGQEDSTWKKMNIRVSVRRMLCELRTQVAHNLRAAYVPRAQSSVRESISLSL